MTHNEALQNKSDCILAYLRGEKVEIATSSPHGAQCWFAIHDKPYFGLPGDQYRIAPKSEPKLPKGVFWVKLIGAKECPASLVTVVDNIGRCVQRGILTNREFKPTKFDDLFAMYHWSHDRETWYTFDNHETPVK